MSPATMRLPDIRYTPINQTPSLEDEREGCSEKKNSKGSAWKSALKNGLLVFLALSNLAMILRISVVSSHVERLPADFGEPCM